MKAVLAREAIPKGHTPEAATDKPAVTRQLGEDD